jgi:predicted nucleotidyltransferase
MQHRRHSQNLAMLMLVARHLGSLKEKVVFLGGTTVGLLITDSGAPDVRATTDVDLIVEVATQHDYHAIEATMRQLGFAPEVHSGVRCRWLIDHIMVDLMPTDEKILGFSNRWYSAAIKHAVDDTLPDGQHISRVSAPYFIATKIEAFLGRGNHDFIMSHDFEDLMAVIDGREELGNECANVHDPQLRGYIAKRFSTWLQDRDFMQAIPCHLPPDDASIQRYSILEARIKRLALLT